MTRLTFLWRKIIKPFVFPLLIGVTIGLLIIPMFENRIIFHPFKYPEGMWTPSVYGVRAEDCYFSSGDSVKLHGWFCSVDSPRATILFCHGNAGNITHRLDKVRKLQSLRLNVFIFDYRGFGRSDGGPSEAGIYSDAIAAYEYLVQHFAADTNRILLFGESIGTAVAVDLATKKHCCGLILESALTSAADYAQTMKPWLPLRFFIHSKFESIVKIRNVHVPLLSIHGTDDKTIPFALGRKLFEAANEPRWFYEIPGAGHNDTFIVGGQAYLQRIEEFVTTVLQPG